MSQMHHVLVLIQKIVKACHWMLSHSSTVLAPNTPTNLFPSSLLSSKMIPRMHSLILQILWLDLLPYLYFIIWSSLPFDTQQFEFRFNPFLSYEAIINAYVQAQLLKHWLFYFSQMINKGLTPGPNTYIIFWVFLSNQIVLRKLCVFSMKQRGIFKWMYVVLGLWLKVVVRLWFV